MPAAASQLVIAAQPPTSVAAGAASDSRWMWKMRTATWTRATRERDPVPLGRSGRRGARWDAQRRRLGRSGELFRTLDRPRRYGVPDRGVGPGPRAGDHEPVAVTSAGPAQLVIEAGPPSSVTAGAGFGLTVSVEDAYGNVETGYGGNVTVGLAGGPRGAASGGTTRARHRWSGDILRAAGSPTAGSRLRDRGVRREPERRVVRLVRGDDGDAGSSSSRSSYRSP